MNYILFKNGKAVHITSESPWTGTPVMKEFTLNGKLVEYDTAKTARELDSFEEATKVAAEISTLTGKTWIPFDNGDSTSHRFGIIEPPQVGDKVSKAFNGDYYPQGEVVKVTRTKVETSTGATFRRKKHTSSWIATGGTFSLVHGHIDERNPSF